MTEDTKNNPTEELDAIPTEEEFKAIPPESFKATEEDIVNMASEFARGVISGIPNAATPAQSRILLEDSVEIYDLVAKILAEVVRAKTGNSLRVVH